MPTEILMPKLGLNMSEGLLVEWLKKEGDPIKKGDALFTVETDKVTTESLAQADGTLSRILIEAGETVPVRTVVALLAAEGESIPETVVAQSSPPAPKAADATEAARPDALPPRSDKRVLASPLAKRLAQEHHIDLSAVQGTGADGRISQEDVERFLQSAPAPVAAPAQDAVRIAGVRAVIAERMLKSVQSTAQLTLHSEIDASALALYREKLKSAAAPGASVPSYNAILISAAARALKEHPRLNARQEGDQILLQKEIHVGLAVDTEAGLVVVVVRNADQKSIPAIHQELAELTQRALAGKSMPDDLSGSTFTISNLGMYGIDAFTPILNPPEIAILGVGRILEKLVFQNGRIAQTPVVTLSLTFDHRLVDGAPAARFLQSIGTQINQLA